MSRTFPQVLLLLVLAIVVLTVPHPTFASTVATAPWPGQSGNPVGHTAWPGWTGSFSTTPCPSSPASGSSWSNATVVQNCTYTGSVTISCNYCEFLHVDFAGAPSGGNVWVQGSHVLLAGDRFQSNQVTAGNVGATGSYIYFFYDSMTPLVSYATSPPGSTWPSAGAGTNSMTMTAGSNSIPYNHGYEYGVSLQGMAGPVWIDHCDMWGFGDAIVLPSGSTGQVTITNNWMHDPREPGGVDHTDGPGYTNGAVGPNNVTMIGNTTALLGNTNALALQAATGGYSNILVNNNFWSGDGGTISFCRPGSVQCTNSTFYGNTFGTDVRPGGPVYSAGAALGSGTVWACNTISFRPGTAWKDANDPWTPTAAMDGQFFVNSATYNFNSTTDQGGNAYCGIPAPSSFNFANQSVNGSSTGTTVTYSNTNSGTLTIKSIALANGTQFSISSNTCGATLAAGSSCSITVEFAPKSAGPQTDSLLIAANTPGASATQVVPLAGVGGGTSGVVPPSALSGTVR